MGLFELLFERLNPGRIGHIEKNRKLTAPIKPYVLVIKLIMSSLFVWTVYYVTISNRLSTASVIKFVFILSLYCIISYIFIPKPDSSNIGWMGGLIDNPFRYSDDLNRMLCLLLVVMYPGRFITTTVLQCFNFIKSRR